MSEFILLFRRDVKSLQEMTQLPKEQLQTELQPWQNWIKELSAENKIVNTGNRLKFEGRVVKANNLVTDGPFAEIKEGLGGYIIVNAENYEEAVEIAKGCPVLQMGGSVEIRMPADTTNNN
jgi:hypothetical protein